MNMRYAKEEEIDDIKEIWNSLILMMKKALLIITSIISMTIIIPL